jgi:hypothetical protein
LVDLMLVLFAALYFAKVSAQIGGAILAAVVLLRWRRGLAGCRWLYLRFYSGRVIDPIDVMLYWNTRCSVSRVLPIVAMAMFLPSSMLALSLEYPGRSAKSENFYWWLAITFLPTVLILLVIVFGIWRCPACGRNPGSHPWGTAVYKCEQCGARLKYWR